MSTHCAAGAGTFHRWTFRGPAAILVALVLPGWWAAAALGGDDNKPADLGKLQRQLRQEYKSGQYEAALKTAEKIHEQKPGDVEAMYNLACLNCLVGKNDQAYEWLGKAIDAGYRDVDGLIADADFRTIRGEDRFRALVRRIREATAPPASDEKAGRAGKPAASEKKSEQRDKQAGTESTGRRSQTASANQPGDKPVAKKPVKKLSPEEAQRRINELTAELIDTSSAGESEKALKIAMEAYDIAKASEVKGLISLTSYNAACMHSLMKHTDEAFKFLEEAIAAGGGFTRDLSAQMEGDSDLDHIRKDDRYKKLLEKARTVRPPAQGGRSRNAGPKVGFRYEVTPPRNLDKNKPAPLVVALHGAGSTAGEEKDTWRQASSRAGAILLTPQGTLQRGSAYHWGDDLDEIEENILSAIDDVMEKHKVDKKKIVIAGFSQGGQVAYALALRNPDVFCGVIPVCGMCNESESAFNEDDVKKLRVCVMT
jgi:tetratricopeptide (TPR) repeat protein